LKLPSNGSSETSLFPRTNPSPGEQQNKPANCKDTHLKISLNEEAGGAKKAKLKDQLMAVYGLTEFAIVL
jgi:hypothetical protein